MWSSSPLRAGCGRRPWAGWRAASPPARPSPRRTEPGPRGRGWDEGGEDPVYWGEGKRRRITGRRPGVRGSEASALVMKEDVVQSITYYRGVRRSRNRSLTSRTTSAASVSGSLILTWEKRRAAGLFITILTFFVKEDSDCFYFIVFLSLLWTDTSNKPAPAGMNPYFLDCGEK